MQSRPSSASAFLSAILGVACLIAMVACLVLTIRSLMFATGPADGIGAFIVFMGFPAAIAFGVLTLVFMMGLFISLDLYMAAVRRNREH